MIRVFLVWVVLICAAILAAGFDNIYGLPGAALAFLYGLVAGYITLKVYDRRAKRDP